MLLSETTTTQLGSAASSIATDCGSLAERISKPSCRLSRPATSNSLCRRLASKMMTREGVQTMRQTPGSFELHISDRSRREDAPTWDNLSRGDFAPIIVTLQHHGVQSHGFSWFLSV